MTKLIRAAAAGLTAAALVAATPVVLGARQQDKAAADANTVKVTVTYKGKGTVDPTHKIWVWLFTSPDIGPGSIPIDERSTAKNGDTLTFSHVNAPQVWVAVAYDEGGGFMGQAPPPPGSPIGMPVSAEGKPAGVTPGAKGTVSVTFDDSIRMQ